MELFKILGTIALDNSGANKGIDETGTKAEQLHSRMSSAFSKIGSVAAAAGKAVATGLAVGATAMGKLTLDALNLGGELEQNLGGAKQVFEDNAWDMEQIAKGAFSSMGLSASDFLATANKMGALFQGAGFNGKETFDMTTEAMQRAADVASIMGIDTSAAMEAIAGAAKGNFTMMDNLGVAMNDTAIAAYALEKGIKKSTSQMTQQEKIGLAMEMFLDKTSYAAGNYAKENETLAGSLSTAKAALSNFLSGAGDAESLVTALVDAASVITQNLQVILPRLVEGLQQLVNQLLPYLPGFIEALLPGVIDGAMALLTGLIVALPEIMAILLNQIPNILSQIGTALTIAFPALLDTCKQLFGQIWDYIAIELLGTEADFESSFAKIEGIFQGLWTAAQYIWQTIGQPIWDAIQNCIDIVKGVFEEKMPEIREFVSQCFGDIKSFWDNNLKPCFDAIGGFIRDTLAPIFQTVFETLIKGSVETAFNFIKSMWNDTLKPVFTGITDFLTGVFTGDWEKAWNGIGGIVTGIANGIIGAAEGMVNGAIDVLNGLIEGINSLGVVEAIANAFGSDGIPLIERISIPRLEKGGVLERGQMGFLEGNGAEAVVPLDQNEAWISAVAKDMSTAGIGGNSEQADKIINLLQTLVDILPETMVDAFASMKFDINNREFARLVKAVN